MTHEQQIQWLYDVEQIKQLKHRYCGFCDENYNPEGISALFTEDGIWEGGTFGRAHGRAAIYEFFSNVSKQVSFANHYVTNAIIDINGDSAAGRWDLWQPMVMGEKHTALWLVAKYKDSFVRSNAGWSIQRIEVDIKALSPYDTGFGKERFITSA